MKNTKKICGFVLALTCGLATTLNAQYNYNYTTLRVPGAQDTIPCGISGNYIVGYYTENGGETNFLYNISSNTYSTFNAPGQAYGISGNNIVIASGPQSWVYNISSDSYSALPKYFGTFGTAARGISGNSIVGGVAGTTPQIGFLYTIGSGSYSTLNAPAAQITEPFGIDGNNIVGTYELGASGGYAWYGFLYNGSTYITLPSIGGQSLVNPTGISGTNIVGQLSSGGSVIYNGSTYTPIIGPGGAAASVEGIDGNNIVGYYASGGITYGFLGTPAPPKVGFAMAGSQIQIIVPGSSTPGIVQESSNLVNWASVYTNILPFTFTDAHATNQQDFYRVIFTTNPIVQFTAGPISGAVPVIVQFHCPSVDSAGNNLVARQWNFGDGTISALQNPSHTYLTVGTFSPALVATNTIGGTVIGSGPAVVTVTNATVQFTAVPTNGAAPLVVQFNCPGVDNAGNNLGAWNWNFGDGTTSSLQNPSHTYQVAGTFSPSLVATNVNGGTVIGYGPGTIAVTNPVNPNVWTFDSSSSVTFIPSSSFNYNPVVPNFRYNYGSANSSATFQWSSQEANGNPNSGSVEASLTLNESLDTTGTKGAFVIDLAGGNGINATNLSFDLMITPGSATDEYGGYGEIGVATLTGQWNTFNSVWDGPSPETNYEFGPSWGIPYTAGSWYHFNIPLTGSAATGINAINIQVYDGGSKDINGTINFYIGNLTLSNN